MFHDEFSYRPKFNPFFRTLCMRFEGEGGEGGEEGGGGGEEHWTDNYESTKGSAVLRRFETEEDSHKGHLETKTALGDPLRLPKSLGKITDEQRADYKARLGKLLGAPDTEDGYEITRPQLPKGMSYDEEGEKMVRAWGIKHHLSQAAVQDALNLWNQVMVGRTEAITKADKEDLEKAEKDNKTEVKACIKNLEELWGKKECAANLELIQRALRSKVNPDWRNVKIEDDEAWQDFNEKTYNAGIANNQVLMEMLGVAAQVIEGEGKLSESAPSDTEKKPEDMSEGEIQKTYFPKSPDMNK